MTSLRDEIPDTSFRNESKRIDDALGWAVVAVHHPHFAIAPDRVLQQRKMRNLLAAAIPSVDIDIDALPRELGVALREFRQHELQVRKLLLRSRYEHFLKFRLTQSGQVRAIAFHQTPPAARPALRNHR